MDDIQRSRRLLPLVTVFFWASEYCHVPYFTPYLHTLGLGASLIGFLVGCYGFVQMIVRIPLGIATDLTGRYKAVILIGTLCTTVSSLGLYAVTNVVLLFVFRALAGVAASTWIAFSVLYAGFFPPEEGVKAMAQMNAFNNTGKLLAFGAGTVVAGLFGYRAPLLISCLTGFVACLLALGLKDVRISKSAAKPADLIAMVRQPRLLRIALLAAVAMMIVHATAFSFTSDVAKGVGATTVQVGINTALFTVVQILAARFIGSARVKSVPRQRLYLFAFGLMTVYCLLIAFAPNIWVLFTAQLVGGLGNALLFSVLPAQVVAGTPPEKKSTAMGIYQAVYGVGMTLGPVLMGRLVESFGYTPGYLLFGCAAFLTGTAAYGWMQHSFQK